MATTCVIISTCWSALWKPLNIDISPNFIFDYSLYISAVTFVVCLWFFYLKLQSACICTRFLNYVPLPLTTSPQNKAERNRHQFHDCSEFHLYLIASNFFQGCLKAHVHGKGLFSKCFSMSILSNQFVYLAKSSPWFPLFYCGGANRWNRRCNKIMVFREQWVLFLTSIGWRRYCHLASCLNHSWVGYSRRLYIKWLRYKSSWVVEASSTGEKYVDPRKSIGSKVPTILFLSLKLYSSSPNLARCLLCFPFSADYRNAVGLKHLKIIYKILWGMFAPLSLYH